MFNSFFKKIFLNNYCRGYRWNNSVGIFHRVEKELRRTPLQLLNRRRNNSVGIFKRVEKKLRKTSLQLLNHQRNNFIGIFQRVEKQLMQTSLQLTKGITDGLKRIIVFWHAWFVCKNIGKFINDRLTDRLEITNEFFFTNIFRPWFRR